MYTVQSETAVNRTHVAERPLRGSFCYAYYMEQNKDNPNEQLTPIYIGEKLIWVTVPEYYLLHLGSVAVGSNLLEFEGINKNIQNDV